MAPRPGLLALASFLLSVPALAGPACPPPGSGGVSTNWGSDYRERVREIFDVVKREAGVTQDVALINVNDLRPQNGGTRMVDGSPISAVPKGTQGLPTDAVIYTFGVFEIACDEAQLAFFMAHEMRHLKKGPDGRSHFDRVADCRKGILRRWMSGTDLSAYPDDKAALEAFQKAKGGEIATTCVLPVENEADAFATELAPRLPWKIDDPERPDPNRDARYQAFKNAEKWIDALGLPQSDPGHGTMADRAAKVREDALKRARARHAAIEEKLQQSVQPNF